MQTLWKIENYKYLGILDAHTIEQSEKNENIS